MSPGFKSSKNKKSKSKKSHQSSSGGRGLKSGRSGGGQRGAHRRTTQELSCERVAVGIHACREAVQVRPQAVKELWLAENWAQNVSLKELHDQAQASGIVIAEKHSKQLGEWASSHQGVAAFLTESPTLAWDNLQEKDEEPQLLLALDQVEDPHNLGAIMRTAWLMGVKGILLPPRRSVSLTPAAHKVACGAAEHVAVDNDMALVDRLKALKEKGFWVFGLDGKGQRPLWDKNKWPTSLVLVVGSEGKGLARSVEKVCDELVSIPQVHSAASYNASVAVGLACSEFFRQQT